MTQTPAAAPASSLWEQNLRHHRILLLDGELDDTGGSRLCSELLQLSAEDPRSDIALWINSPGGSVPAMLAIADVIDLIPNDVSTAVLGIALSAGQFLLTAGTPGKRVALPHSRILMHQGSAGIGGTAVDIELQADDLKHTRDTVLGIIAERTGQSAERIWDDSLRDRWFTAVDAMDYGFVDRIVDSVADIWPVQTRTIGLLPQGEGAKPTSPQGEGAKPPSNPLGHGQVSGRVSGQKQLAGRATLGFRMGGEAR